MPPLELLSVVTPAKVLASTGSSVPISVDSVPFVLSNAALAEKLTPRANIPDATRTNSFRIWISSVNRQTGGPRHGTQSRDGPFLTSLA